MTTFGTATVQRPGPLRAEHHTHFHVLSGSETGHPGRLQIDILLRRCVLYDKFSFLYFLAPGPTFLKLARSTDVKA